MDPTAASRSTIRRLLSALGMPTNAVDAVENIDEALNKIEVMRPNIVISEMDLTDGRSGFELLAIQRRLYPSTLQTIFIFLSSKNSPIITSMAAESDADGLVIKPLNYAIIENKVVEVARVKATPTEYLTSIETAKTKIFEKDYGGATQLLSEAIKQDPKPALAHYLLGVSFLEQGQNDQAKNCFEEGLKSVSSHYKCLMGVFDYYYKAKNYSKAYEIGLQVTKSHTIPPKRIPDFIRVSVQNHKFEDVLSLYDVVMDIDSPDDLVVTYISAAMVLCGKLFIRRDEKAKAIEILQRAQAFSKAKEKIQVEIISTLYSAGLEKEADQFMLKVQENIRFSPEMRVVEMEDMIRRGNLEGMMKIGLPLLKLEVKNLKLYELMIEQSMKLNRSIASIHSTVNKAAAIFPDKKAYFEGMIKDYSPPDGEDDEDDEDDEE